MTGLIVDVRKDHCPRHVSWPSPKLGFDEIGNAYQKMPIGAAAALMSAIVKNETLVSRAKYQIARNAPINPP